MEKKLVGKTINTLRISKGLSLEELSLRAEISLSQLYYLESGSRNAGVKTLFKVLNALDVDFSKVILDSIKNNS